MSAARDVAPEQRTEGALVRIGIIGCNFGRLVHLPGFRRDARCEVVGLAGRDATRTRDLAVASNVPMAFGHWQDLVEHPSIDAVAIATPPSLQPAIAIRALELGKPVFAEKPMAADLAAAERMARAAQASRRTTMVDFNFSEILTWRRAKELLQEGAIGRLRHVGINWHVENYATRMRIKSWKVLSDDGGGALGNFVSHCFHYLEWFCGPVVGMSARLSGTHDATETTAHINLAFQSGAAGHVAMSCASYLGSGHRLEFYGEDGTMTLVNTTADYMRGFRLSIGQRPANALTQFEVDDPVDREFPADSRIAPVSRMAAAFLDGIEGGQSTWIGFEQGLRVQALLDTARRANHLGRWLDIDPSSLDQKS
ncbi:MAG TPA: Gfo/Idh/MocA family oxidoreductase [Sphingomicrobium sp.]|nr:Gfo/Idh/MocA family oxidoreductase [Sphingomicrobium sp.]